MRIVTDNAIIRCLVQTVTTFPEVLHETLCYGNIGYDFFDVVGDPLPRRSNWQLEQQVLKHLCHPAAFTVNRLRRSGTRL